MEPNAFVAEVYRRMSLRHAAEHPKSFAEIQNDSRVLVAMAEYASILPSDKTSAILDIGFGGGWFLGACLKLGYTNLSVPNSGLKTSVTLPTGRKEPSLFTKSHPISERFSAITQSNMTSSICRTSSSTSRNTLCSGQWMRFTGL